MATAQPAEAAPAETAAISKPLSLVNHKASAPRKAKTARKAPVTAIAKKQPVDRAIQDAHAQAPEAVPMDESNQDAAATPAPGMPVVPADEVNEIDQAAPHETQATAAPVEPAQASTAAEPEPRLSLARAEPENVTVAESRDGAWEQSSLIGKIFIAFGGLLTAASAVRMFIG